MSAHRRVNYHSLLHYHSLPLHYHSLPCPQSSLTKYFTVYTATAMIPQRSGSSKGGTQSMVSDTRLSPDSTHLDHTSPDKLDPPRKRLRSAASSSDVGRKRKSLGTGTVSVCPPKLANPPSLYNLRPCAPEEEIDILRDYLVCLASPLTGCR